jgi:hypothetical protein
MRALTASALALLLVMIAKGFAFLWHSPLYAYANNYDQVRTMSQFGIVPDDPRYPLGIASFPAPMAQFHLEPQVSGFFYPSSDQLLVRATIWLSQVLRPPAGAEMKQPVNVRWKGTLSFLLLAIGFGLCVRQLLLQPETRGPAVVLAATGVALTDPFNLLYASTWYLEYSGLVFAALGLAALYVAMVKRPAATVSLYLGWMLILLFGATKYQYQFFPIGLIAFIALFWRARFDRRFLVIAVLSALLVPVYVARLDQHPNNVQIAGANNANSLFNVFLTLPEDRNTALQLAGLPQRCERFVGTTWFRPANNAEAIMAECPEIVKVGQWRKLLLAGAAPGPFVAATFHAAGLSQDWLDPLVGHVGGKHWGSLHDERSPVAFSVASLVGQIPKPLYAAAYLLVLAVATLGGGVLGRHPRFARWAMAYALCGLLGSYAFICAFFGEGFNDVQKHAHLSFSALLVIALLAVVHAASCAVSRVPRRERSLGLGVSGAVASGVKQNRTWGSGS